MVMVHWANFNAVREAVISEFGEDAWKEFEATLPEEIKEIFSSSQQEKYNIRYLVNLLNLAENKFGNGMGKFIQKVGETEADLLVYTMRMEGLSMMIHTPEDVLKYAPISIPPQIFEKGKGELVESGEHYGTFRIGLPYLYKVPGTRMALQHLTIGGIRYLLAKKGCSEVRVSSVKLGEWEDKVPYIEISMEWKCNY